MKPGIFQTWSEAIRILGCLAVAMLITYGGAWLLITRLIAK